MASAENEFVSAVSDDWLQLLIFLSFYIISQLTRFNHGIGLISVSLHNIQTMWSLLHPIFTIFTQYSLYSNHLKSVTSMHVGLAQPKLVLRRYDAWAWDYNRGHDLDLRWGGWIIGLQNDDAAKYDCFRRQLILPVSVSIIICCPCSGRTKTHLSKLQLYPEDLAVIAGLDTVRHVLLSY